MQIARVEEFRNNIEVMPGTDIPANTPIDGERLIGDVQTFVTRYVIQTGAARLPVALWAVATHFFELFDCFPYLSLWSPTPRCGKTRLLEILELLVARPWRGTAPTEAALFRFIEEKKPTLLLDEVEGLAKRKASERESAVLAILNAGYKQGQTVPRCAGKENKLQQFRVYCPKAFATIGHLPATLANRSIVIPMQRRAPGESVARYRLARIKREANPIRAAVERAGKAFAGGVKTAYDELPELSFLTDRDDEIFSPLFAVCLGLAPGRVQELEKSAKSLCAGKADDAVDDSLALLLLHGIHDRWPEGEGNWLSKEIVAALKDIEDAPWQSDYILDPRRLARLLKPFEVYPRQVKTDSGDGKGYTIEEVQRAISRYPAPARETCETDRVNAA